MPTPTAPITITQRTTLTGLMNSARAKFPNSATADDSEWEAMLYRTRYLTADGADDQIARYTAALQATSPDDQVRLYLAARGATS